MKKDIGNREDLMMFVTRFYEKLLADPSISYLFTDVAKIDLQHHLPVLVDFWDMVLFHSDTYAKNAMQPHMILHSKSPLNAGHFETWLNYFSETLDELFQGPITETARLRAKSIAAVMQMKTQANR